MLKNQKILDVINRLQEKAEYEQQNKGQFQEKDRMLAITQDTGRFYNILLKGMRAKKVLEVGLSHGYSTLWFADAMLDQKGSVTTIENNPAKVKIARKNLADAGVENLVKIIQGDALGILQEMQKGFDGTKSFDFVFLDADKENSIRYFEMCIKMLRVGGIIAADNVLDMEQMQDYVRHVQQQKNILTVTLPVGWGQEISLKIN